MSIHLPKLFLICAAFWHSPFPTFAEKYKTTARMIFASENICLHLQRSNKRLLYEYLRSVKFHPYLENRQLTKDNKDKQKSSRLAIVFTTITVERELLFICCRVFGDTSKYSIQLGLTLFYMYR